MPLIYLQSVVFNSKVSYAECFKASFENLGNVPRTLPILCFAAWAITKALVGGVASLGVFFSLFIILQDLCRLLAGQSWSPAGLHLISLEVVESSIVFRRAVHYSNDSYTLLAYSSRCRIRMCEVRDS